MSADREALIALVAGEGVWLDRCSDVADAILASDWLAQRDNEQSAEGVASAAHDPLFPGDIDTRQWLEDRAATIRTAAP